MRALALPLLLFSLRADALFGDVIIPKRTPATGPCTLNDDGMKCNDNGYYASVQCNSEWCFCVTPHTGVISYDTRTTSPKTAPKCGACLVYLQKLFANGDPPENSFVPKCDVSKGDFEAVQCDQKKNECYCVDTSTGREVSGTRSVLSNTKTMNCKKIDFSIDSTNFPTFVKPDPSQPTNIEPVGRPWCLKNRDPGHKCSQNITQVKYWFDYKTFLCLPFEHKGCGGNENSYPTQGACYSDCVLADWFSCALRSAPARKSSGQYYVCGIGAPPPSPPWVSTTTTPGPILNETGCPKGYVCQNGAFFGICCQESLTNRYHEAFKPKCKNKKPSFTRKEDGWESAVIGKSCSDRFCPSTHNCETNEFFAFCCPK